MTYDENLIKLKDSDGRTALHLACQGGHYDVVLAVEPQLKLEGVREAPDDQDNRPLHLACGSNSTRIVKLLVDNEADISIKNKKSEIPLHIASQNGNVEIGKLLVTGVDLAKMKDSGGRNPLHTAVLNNRKDMIDFLCQW